MNIDYVVNTPMQGEQEMTSYLQSRSPETQFARMIKKQNKTNKKKTLAKPEKSLDVSKSVFSLSASYPASFLGYAPS